jgi:hypothetical protein
MKRDIDDRTLRGPAVRLLNPRHHFRMPSDRALRTAACLDDDVIAALADGSVDASERAAALSHVADCTRCSALLGSVARAIADPAVSREVSRVAVPSRRRLYLAIPIAAAAVLALWIMPRGTDRAGDRHRDPVPIAAPIPTPVEPAGTVAQAVSFRWRSVAGARQYRVILFNQRGDVLFESQTADTSAPLPRNITIVAGRAYLWKVEARLGFDRSIASDLQEFTVAGPQR